MNWDFLLNKSFAMNREHYKRLGDYIRLTDIRNRDLSVTNLLGVSVDKTMFPSIANTIGTDFAAYKVIYPGQFVYIADTSRRGDKIAISLMTGSEPAIVSSAYTTFEVINPDDLNPSFLLMWFSRPEFDRYARYKSNGSAREIFSWDEMCDVYLPIPNIQEQQRIVAEYQAVQTRITTNERLINKLEEMCQSLYKKMFVDDIDFENLPLGWKMGTLGELAEFKYGKLPEKHEQSEEYPIPVYSGYAITGYTSEEMYSEHVVVIIARGDAGTGRICLSPKKCFLTNLAIAIIAKDNGYTPFMYYYLSNSDTYSLRSGSAQAQITVNSLIPYKVLIPAIDVCKEFKRLITPVFDYSDCLERENKLYERIKSVLLSRMTLSA